MAIKRIQNLKIPEKTEGFAALKSRETRKTKQQATGRQKRKKSKREEKQTIQLLFRLTSKRDTRAVFPGPRRTRDQDQRQRPLCFVFDYTSTVSYFYYLIFSSLSLSSSFPGRAIPATFHCSKPLDTKSTIPPVHRLK